MFQRNRPMGRKSWRYDTLKRHQGDLGSSNLLFCHLCMFPHYSELLPKFLPSPPESRQQDGKERKCMPISYKETFWKSPRCFHFLPYPDARKAKKCPLSVRQQWAQLKIRVSYSGKKEERQLKSSQQNLPHGSVL